MLSTDEVMTPSVRVEPREGGWEDLSVLRPLEAPEVVADEDLVLLTVVEQEPHGFDPVGDEILYLRAVGV